MIMENAMCLLLPGLFVGSLVFVVAEKITKSLCELCHTKGPKLSFFLTRPIFSYMLRLQWRSLGDSRRDTQNQSHKVCLVASEEKEGQF